MADPDGDAAESTTYHFRMAVIAAARIQTLASVYVPPGEPRRRSKVNTVPTVRAPAPP